MPDLKAPDYWSILLLQIRTQRGWSQIQLAKELGVSNDTVSRWEKEHKYPSIENQKRISELADIANVASLFGITQVVDMSPFPIILTDRNDFILAASASSGFTAGETVWAQTPADERQNYERFSGMVADSGFWERAGNVFEYNFTVNSEIRKAIIHSIGSRGHIFAVVQKQ